MPQRLLMVLGLALLAPCFEAKVQGAFSPQLAIPSFEVAQNSPAIPGDRPPQKASTIDVSLWSSKRVQAYKYALAQHFEPPLALLRISKIHLEVPVFNGTDELTLDRGLGRITGTANVGTEGNLGIAGHRDGFFRGLKDLRRGDTIDLVTVNGTETYMVDNIHIVKPADVSVLQAGSGSSLTLVTCYPFYFVGSAPRRYIVHSSRVAPTQSSENH